MYDALQSQKHFCDHKYQDQTFSIGDIVLLSTKNLTLPGICKLQPQLMGPFGVMTTGPGTYHLDLLPSIAAVHPWFYNNLFKPAGPQPAGPPTLADDSYKVKAILQINKHKVHAKVKWEGYDPSQNRWIWLLELQDTATEVVNIYLRGKEREKVSLRPRKST